MGRRLGPKEAVRRLTASERQAKAVELYTEGWTMRVIAEELGYAGASSVKAAIDAAIAKSPSRAVHELRAKVDEELSALRKQLWPVLRRKRLSDEVRCAVTDRLIKINREERALHGLDAPAQSVQLTAELPMKNVRDELLDRLSRLVDAESAGKGDREPDGG